MSTPLITVGMPAYNHACFVGHAIESVLNQTFTDWELIIIDDASTDGTLDVIRRYNDPRIQIIAHPKNCGPGAAANTYLQTARGTWITPLPSDDAYAPTRLEEQLTYLESHPDVGMVMTQYRFIDDNNEPFDPHHNFIAGQFDYTDRSRSQWLRYFFDIGNCIPASSMMHHRRYFEKEGLMDHRLLQLQDYDYWLRMALGGCNFGFIHKPLTDYRIHKGGGNLSTPSLNVYHRCVAERAHILRQFGRITHAQELKEIFPEIEVPRISSEQEPVWVRYQLARRAWENGSTSHRQFAFETWFDLFKDQQQVEWLDTWGMNIRQFYDIMAQSPLTNGWCHNIKYILYQHVIKLLPTATRQWGHQAIKRLAQKAGGR